jgi:hypothetical protein
MAYRLSAKKLAAKILSETAKAMADYVGDPNAFYERLKLAVQMEMDAAAGGNSINHPGSDVAVRCVISGLISKVHKRDVATFEGLMREILDADAILLEIAEDLYGDLYAYNMHNLITPREIKVMQGLERILLP